MATFNFGGPSGGASEAMASRTGSSGASGVDAAPRTTELVAPRVEICPHYWSCVWTGAMHLRAKVPEYLLHWRREAVQSATLREFYSPQQWTAIAARVDADPCVDDWNLAAHLALSTNHPQTSALWSEALPVSAVGGGGGCGASPP